MAFGGGFGPAFRRTFALGAGAASATMTNFLIAAYTGTRNNFDGWVGYEFAPNQAIAVLAIGRSISGSIAQDHVVSVYRVSDQVKVATATITPSSPVAANGYAYEPVAVALSSGAAYRIISAEFSGGDLWRDLGSLSSNTGVASITYGVYKVGVFESYPVSPWGGANEGFVPVTFFY